MIGPALGAGSQIMGGMSQSKAYQRQAESDLKSAYLSAALERVEADNLKQKAERDYATQQDLAVRVAATQSAEQAASGVIVGEGSAGAVTSDTYKRVQADAIVGYIEARNAAVSKEASARFQEETGRTRASDAYAAGDAALARGFMNASASLANYKLMTSRDAPRTGSTLMPPAIRLP